MSEDTLLAGLAELAITGGANMQPGQVVAVSSEPGKEPLARAVAEAAYRHGARFVDVASFDLHVKRARIEHGDDLDYVPPWIGQRLLALGELHAARVALAGPVAPGLFNDLDPARVGRDQLPMVPEAIRVVNDRTTNWTIVPCPTPAWAALVHPDADDALERLRADLAHVCRLDAPDPSQAWRERADGLTAAAARLNEARFDALRFDGAGTRLTVGLLASSRWLGGWMETVDGIRHIPNLPTEEVFTAPDPERVDGEVRATKPLVIGGTVIRGLRVRFEGGRAVDMSADEGGEVLATMTRRDKGGARLGEVALVDREGRIGPMNRVFYDTLLDENAASHVALGAAYAFTASEEDRERINRSAIHIDFMIGGEDVTVTGVRADGSEAPVMRGGVWQL